MGEDLELPVPAGARVLHIGPHKTGTTSVQGAFHRARAAALAQGVRYAGPNRHPVAAAQAVIGVGAREARDAMGRPTSGADSTVPRLYLWHRLVREVASAREPRVVISSEWFADASDATIRRVVGDLGADQVHVAVTVRPLERLLPSQWQQYAMAGFAQPFQPWLEAVLAEQGEAAMSSTPSFWRRHRHDELVRRWAQVVGPERVFVVVADDRDHRAVLRAFERLTGLEEATLELEAAGANRSLTAPEIEVVRAINAAITKAGLSAEWRLALGLFGATAALRRRTPPADEARLRMPDWAAARARAIGTEIADGLRDSGARVIGDLDWLSGPADPGPERAAGDGDPDARAGAPDWPTIVGTALAGVVTAAGLARRWPDHADRSELQEVSSARLREVLASRVRELGARRRPRGTTAGVAAVAPMTRPLTRVESEVVDALAALRNAGLGRGAIGRVSSAVRHELLAGAAPEGPEAATWLTTAGNAAIGIARLRGLVPRSESSTPGRRRAVETLEVAGVSTLGIAAMLGTRAIGRLGRSRDRWP